MAAMCHFASRQDESTSQRSSTPLGLRLGESRSLSPSGGGVGRVHQPHVVANKCLSPSHFPSLPGFSRHGLCSQQGPRKQSLNFVNGFMMVNSPPPGKCLVPILQLPPNGPYVPGTVGDKVDHDMGRYSFFRQKADRCNNRRSLPFSPSSRLPPFLEHDRRVLLFHAYYEEDVFESPVESKRLHICELYYFVEDGTIEIVQTKQENSGIPQGVFLRRSRVLKPGAAASTPVLGGACAPFYEIDDLKIGSQIEIYCRTFHIVSCNESTRSHVMKAHDWREEDVASLPLPHDNFAELNRIKMSRESGVPGIDRKRKMNDLKQVMESMLGKPTAMADRGAFLECGQDTLCFHVVWDDRKRLYGDIQCFQLMYYLADDTFEIVRIHDKNDGRDQFRKLLKRCKLPRPRCDGFEQIFSAKTAISTEPVANEGSIAIAAASVTDDSEYYNWRHLSIGCHISIFGRTMLIAKCDKFTRSYYASKGVEVSPDLSLKPKEETVRVERQIPPYNGFGSEEDSLRSCTGLHSPPPKKDLAKMREKSGVVLRFNAHLLSDKIEDHTRRFVIQFFMEDDTIGIREPPIQNSGVMGGNFLRRQAIKKTDGSRYEPGDMYVGNLLDIAGHRFVLLNADEYSYRLMENDCRSFPYSDFVRIRRTLGEHQVSIKSYFVSNYDGDGKIDQAELEKCLEAVGLRWNKQEIITLWRKLDKKSKGKTSFTKLVKMAASDLSAVPKNGRQEG